MALIIVEEVEYVIDQMRTKGEIEIISGAPVGTVPCL